MTSVSSFIFRSVAVIIFFLVNVFAFYLLLRGHNLPGGGFIAGLASAISLVMMSLALGFEQTHRVLRVESVRVASAGLLLATLTGLAPVLAGRSFLEQFTIYVTWPVLGKLALGTPLLFDVGVYLVVVGITTKIIFVLAKSTAGLRALVEEEEACFASSLEQPIESGGDAGGDKSQFKGKDPTHAG